MIKINLLPVKKKKKAKPIPGFIIGGIAGFVAVAVVMGYLLFFFSSRLDERKKKVADNERVLAELAKKTKAVDDYEKKNAEFKKQKDVIEQLSKNRLVPVQVLDDISSKLPAGVWISSLSFTRGAVNMACIGFNNTDIVNYVTNLKESGAFSEVNLLESVQANLSGFSVYNFRITLKVK